MDEGTTTAKQWLQDNLRIIVSILIVVAIAAGIYSYSKRTAAPVDDQAGLEISEEMIARDASADQKAAVNGGKSQTAVAVSEETENSFIEKAVKGEGSTHLARRALANYLEKNPDSTLTAEHKIYIEDFLRKNTPDPKKRIFVGTSVEFSKDLIQKAIEKSKNLNENQLKNLHKYAVRVPSLS